MGAIDPALGNNHAATQVAVECVVPVVINIKPASDPNSILASGGTIPVAILTTSAGEGGTPLAFDATAVDPPTGIGVGDTEACVKGLFTDGAGTRTFLGCDAVRVVR